MDAISWSLSGVSHCDFDDIPAKNIRRSSESQLQNTQSSVLFE
jgi:hypothetical protein